MATDEKKIKSGLVTYLTDDPARDKDTGLILEPKEYDEAQEAKRRKHAQGLSHYAEEGEYYDPTGKYLCGGELGDGQGGCNQYRPGSHKCLSVAGRIDGDCGSCGWWETVREDHSDLDLGPEKFSKQEALYGEREPGGTGFGCVRCEYASKAREADSMGRPSWCGIWGMHILPTACCGLNHKLGDKTFEDNRPLTQLEFYSRT